MTKAGTTEVAVAENSSLSLPPELLEEYQEFSTNFSSEEVSLPFIRMLQSGSNALKQHDASFVEGAHPGQILITTSGLVYDELNIIPLRYEHVKLHWRIRNHGGGLLGSYDPGDPSLPATHKVDNEHVVTDDPTSVLEDTYQYICRAFNGDEDLGLAILSCAKSQLKYARKFNVQLQMKKITLDSGKKISAPIFSHVYPLTAVKDVGPKGEWFSFKFGQGSLIKNSAVIQETVDLAKQVNKLEYVQEEDREETSSTTDVQL